MAMNLSNDLKVATYDLQMARPIAQTNLIRDVAGLLEDMLKDVSGVRSYKETKKPEFVNRRSTLPSVIATGKVAVKRAPAMTLDAHR